jgi:hypothetical protein
MPATDETMRRYHAACGMTIRAWAKLEAALTLYIKALLEVDPNRARIVWSTLPSLELRLGLMRQLADTYLDERGLRDLGRLLERAGSLSAWRDMISHANGGVDSRSGQVVFLTGESGRHDTFQLEKIEAWPQEIAALERELLQWLPTFTALVHATPKGHRVGGLVQR